MERFFKSTAGRPYDCVAGAHQIYSEIVSQEIYAQTYMESLATDFFKEALLNSTKFKHLTFT